MVTWHEQYNNNKIFIDLNNISVDFFLSFFIYIYMCVCVCVCVREKEREREEMNQTKYM